MRAYTYSCDKCGESITQATEVLPDGWRMLLVGNDHKPSRWEQKLHLCAGCYADFCDLLDLAKDPEHVSAQHQGYTFNPC